MKLAPYDELTVIREKINGVNEAKITREQKKKQCDELLFDLFLLAYLNGVEDANETLTLTREVEVDGVRMGDSVYREIDGLDYADRVDRWIDSDGNMDVDAIMRIAETEVTYDYNRGAYDTAREVDANRDGYGVSVVRKTWNTMMDERVRDNHQFLEGVTIGINEAFHTPDGDSAQYPGGFGLPENSIGCRCYLTYS